MPARKHDPTDRPSPAAPAEPDHARTDSESTAAAEEQDVSRKERKEAVAATSPKGSPSREGGQTHDTASEHLQGGRAKQPPEIAAIAPDDPAIKHPSDAGEHEVRITLDDNQLVILDGVREQASRKDVLQRWVDEKIRAASPQAVFVPDEQNPARP